MIVLFWIPAIWSSWSYRALLLDLWRQEKPLVAALFALVAWAAISVFWSAAEEPAREAKRLFYVLFFLLGLVCLGQTPSRVVSVLRWAGFGLALAALAALIQRYGLEAKPWAWRAQGFGLLDHPIIGGYVFGMALIWWFCLPPRRTALRVVWAAGLLALFTFIVMTQSRGVWVALLTSVLLMPVWRVGRAGLIVAVLLLLVAAVGYWLFGNYVVARGTSYRPEIFAASLGMVADRSWLGLGLGSEYQVEALGRMFDHAHNLFTHVALELGLPGLVLWLAIWGRSFVIAIQERSTTLGSVLLGMLLFSTMALLFDGANLWDSPRPEWFLTWLPVGLALGLRAGSVTSLCYHFRPSTYELHSPMSGSPLKADTASSLSIYLRLLRYVLPYWGLFAISLLGFLLFASTQPMLGYILKFFVDGLNNPDASFFAQVPHLKELEWLAELKLLQAVPLLIVLIALMQGIGSFFGNYFLAKVSLGLVHDLRVALFNNLLTLPNRYFDSHNSGHLISRITYNVTMVTGAATDAIKVVVREGMTVIFLFGTLLWMNWKLTMVMVAILPVIGVMVSSASKKFRKQSKKIQVAMGDVTHVASETIQGYRVVRSFGGESYEQHRFFGASTDNTAKQLRMVKTNAVYTPTLQLVIYSAMALLMFLVLLLRGDASAGDLVAYITLAGLLPKPIRQLSEVSSTIQKGVAGAESIFEQLDEAQEIDSGTLERDRVNGRLDVSGLSFVYPGTDKQVLHDINFSVEPGQMVALVGRSGSGKSTLANLIPRFYHHDQGQILLDGADIQSYRLRNLRRHIALVTQQVTLFNDTVANNIAYGDLAGAPLEDIQRAARDAYADEFIEQMPEGYQTQVGENGVLLSGGQRQRLAIARALLKNAPVLILDEATSALDTESERHIQGALDHAMTGRTTLVIAHRLSTIEKADLILVMEQGRIVERGTHAELLVANGAYARLHATQFKDEA
ncbi:lipid A export permease/ATP-binding protein MsbA [Pseudomonas sp. MTM4]|nr:lipid A export permease/ATP-binding protein MsbA [Stutzerimonas stutzeri]MBC8649130.1 lipid A export permease/ATP-binding protein MsbA [Pseudomonas sp. MT4]QXY94210.1 lipid A export permease/ATP-binding protein MsbA [Pseudomonas sp. MTM4]